MKIPMLRSLSILLVAIFVLPSLLMAQTARRSRGITIVDQAGRILPNDSVPNVIGQIVDVTVAPNGSRVFSPSTVNISVGDTVRWTWEGSGHSVTSGTPCTIDSQFCSPDDMNCPAGILSNVGTTYEHTFN